MSSLTEEQRLRIEKNRQEALRKRAAKILDVAKTPADVVSENSNAKKLRVGESSTPVSRFYKACGKNNGPVNGASYKQHSNKISVYSNIPMKNEVITGHCKLIRRDRFSVDIGYHSALINLFKSIPSSCYDPASKTWNFSLSDHGKLLTMVSSMKSEVSISPLPKVVLETFLKPPNRMDLSSIDLSKIDSVLVDTLMPFQMEGVRFGISRNGRCLIADEMGLGKTIQALGIAHYFHEDWPLLVVCPSSVKYTWKEAIGNWLPSMVRSGEEVIIISTSKEDFQHGKIVIMSTDMFSKCGNKLSRFQTIIVDESHSLKNSKTARSQVAYKVLREAKRVILLSGTPALSRPIELYHQLTCIDRTGFSRLMEFGIRYCNGKNKPWGWDYSGATNMEELVLLMEERVMIRRLKSDVMEQLPAKTRELIILDPSAVNKRSTEMSATLKNFQSKQNVKNEGRGALLEYFNASGKAKIQAICNYIEDLLEDGHKFICFAHHRIVLDGICQVLQQNGISYVRIDGSTNSGARKELCDEYQLNEKCRVAVLSITAANTGLTLSASSLVIFAELFWNPGILAQAEDRAHRIGQKNNVVVRYLVAEGTVDDYLWPMLQGKLEVLNRMGLSTECVIDADCSHQKDAWQKEITDYFQDMLEDSEIA